MPRRTAPVANEAAGNGSPPRRGASRVPAARNETAIGGTTRSRGECVVCIVLQSPPDKFALCLESVVENTPADILIAIAETCSRDPENAAILRNLAAHRETVLLAPATDNPSGGVAAALAAAAPADVLLLRSDCIVGAGWQDGLRRAAYSASHVASASALGNDAGILSVPERNQANRLPAELTAKQASAAVSARALRLHPRLPTAVARAVYLRRDALDLTGGFDLSLATLDAAVTDFSQRSLASGLVHVAADDVYVFHHSQGKLEPDESLRERDATADPVVASRYPFLSAALGESEQASDRPLPAALARGRRALCGMSVTVDARCLVAPATGTHAIVLETLRALAALNSLRLRAIVPHDLADFAARALAELDVELLDGSSKLADVAPSDLIHRPFQVFGSADFGLLRRLGERLVITHLDLIAYDNPSYFPSFLHWQHHRMVTRIALSRADRVAFLSADAAQEALDEQLVQPEQTVVIHPGVTYSYTAGGERERPPQLAGLGERPFLVSIGTDLHHKNRVFALELLAAMRREHSWPGVIVFAGPRADHGSSAGEEARFLAANPDLREAVFTLPWISEAQKAWLIENSLAVCHPSTREGLGLMPFEAAAYQRPCIFAATTALAEMQPAGLETITPWDAPDSAGRVLRLLADPAAVAQHVEKTRARAAELNWGLAAERLVATFEEAMAAPSRDARRVADDLALSELDRSEVHRKYDELWRALSTDGHGLTGPGGLLDAEDQRALLIVAGRPLLRRIVIGQARLLQRFVRNPAPLPPAPETEPEVFDLHFREMNVNHMREHLAPTNDLEDTH
jgi:glycosyltransferase involved in cell wall biosynthesis